MTNDPADWFGRNIIPSHDCCRLVPRPDLSAAAQTLLRERAMSRRDCQQLDLPLDDGGNLPVHVPGEKPICTDCGIDTIEAGEFYMVHDEVWERARARWHDILCIGCLEQRIGRTLMRDDFTDAPINALGGNSERLHNRLVARYSRRL